MPYVTVIKTKDPNFDAIIRAKLRKIAYENSVFNIINFIWFGWMEV